MRKKILIIMSATGGGHRSVAQSLKEEFESLGYNVSTFDALPSVFKTSYSIISRHLLSFWGFLFWTSSRKKEISKIVSSLGNSIAEEKMRRKLFLSEPDCIISVHPLISKFPSKAFLDHGKKIPFGLVIVDPATTHSVWFRGNPDVYFSPTEIVLKKAIKAGVPKNKIYLTGYPVRKNFYEQVNIKKLRESLGLKPKLFTILIGGSGEGVGNVFEICKGLSELPGDISDCFQVVVICGDNKPLYKKMISKLSSDLRFTILGFQKNMADWMRACDVVISKAGPSNLFEAVAARKPFIAFSCMPGQEEGNLDLIKHEKIGIVEGDSKCIISILKRWIKTPALMDDYKHHIELLRERQKRASLTIVDYIENRLLK